MSSNFIEFNKQAVKQCGSGDGTEEIKNLKIPIRQQVPSARKFTARARKDEKIPHKIQAALKELTQVAKSTTTTPRSNAIKSCRRNLNTTPVAISKRSLTMSEITPKRKKADLNDHSRLRAGATDAAAASMDGDSAGRRVFQLLVLNAWRRRREQVATLTDSSVQQETLVNQLKMQLDVVQKLREWECSRRDQAANSLQETTQRLDLCREELLNLRESTSASFRQLETSILQEKQENERLRNEKEEQESTLLKKIKNAELRVLNYEERINNLQQDYKNCEEESGKTSAFLKETMNERNELKKKVIIYERKAESFEKELNSIKIQNYIADELVKVTQEKLECVAKQNESLEATNIKQLQRIEELENIVETLQNRKWWERASDYMLTPLELLKIITNAILPVIM